MPIIARIDPERALSLRALAARLNDERVPTATGKGQWTAAGVKRVINRAVQASAGSGSRANRMDAENGA